MPKVSIITPLYNNEKFVGQAIGSVLDQTFQDWEMIVVDDCSEDHPEIIISRFSAEDKRIRLIRLEKNIGAAAARNVAIGHASGDYIAFLDADDTWKPGKLQRQIDFMERENVAFCFTSYEVIDVIGNSTGKVIHAPGIMYYSRYLQNTVIGCLTVVVNRRKTGEFSMPLIRSSHDMALWLELMKRGFNAYGIDENLASYRLVGSSNTANKFRAARDVWQVYRDIEKLSLGYSLFCFAGYAFNAIKKRV
jgi:teichuronic acid biosynthesis glycosyltransferase TuaG